MSYKVVWTNKAAKQLIAVPKKQRLLLASWINKNLNNCENPRAIPNSKPLKGTQNGWRYKVGSYRILASILDDELRIDIVRVGHRQGVYGNIPKI